MKLDIRNMLKIFKLSAFFFTLCLTTCISQQKWWNEITKHIAIKLKLHQVLFIVNDNVIDTFVEFNKDARQAMGHIPCLIFTFQHGTASKLQNSSIRMTLANPRSNTLFVIITDSDEMENLKRPIMLINDTSSDSMRPMCLVIFLSTKLHSIDFTKFLQWMWSERFLDVTIIEIIREERKLLINYERKISFIHYFNPFKNVSTKLPYDGKFPWFPNKLIDLHGYKLNGGLYHRPPTVQVKRNSTSHAIEYYGWSVTTAMTLSQLMNFTLNIMPSEKESLGQYDCDRNLQTGILKQVDSHEIQYVMVDTATIVGCVKNKVHDDIIFGIETFVVLVPIIRKDVIVIVGEMLLMETALLIILMTLILWIIFYIVKRGHWQYLDILLLVLQDPSYGNPEEFNQRILFGWIQITGILYSSAIMAGFTAVNFEISSGYLINSLNDLNNSRLQLIADPNIVKFIQNYNHGVINDILDNSILTATVVSHCLNNIASKKFACLIRSSEKLEVLHLFDGKFGTNFVTVLDESLWQTVHISLLEENSPYYERFNQIVGRFFEVGLKQKWIDSNILSRHVPSDNFGKSTDDDSSHSNRINNVLIMLIGIGLGTSTFVFVCEIISHKCHKFNEFLTPFVNINTRGK